MPLIRLCSNKAELKQNELELTLSKLRKSMSEATGKPEKVFLCTFQALELVAIGDEFCEGALLEVKGLGGFEGDLTQSLAANFSKIIQETLDIASDRCHILFEEKERHHWATRGQTFA